MGNILQSLGFGAPQQNVDELAPYRPGFGGGPNPDGSISLAGPGGIAGALNSPYAMSQAIGNMPDVVQNGEGPPALPTPEDANPNIEVSAWKPKKPTILGALADAFLMSKGGKPMYTMMRNQEDMQKAMRGFVSNPKEAIRRVAQIPGMQEKAWEMYNQQTDNETQAQSQERMNRSLDMRNDDYIFNQSAGMMGAATPETWAQMRELAIKRGNARGVDVTQYIPEQYDPTAIEYIRYGTIKPKDQIGIQQKNRGLDQRDRGLDQTDTKIADQRDYRGRRLEQIDAAEEGRDRRDNNNPKTQKGRKEIYGNKAFRSKDGNRLYEWDSTGTLLKQTNKNGKIRFFRSGPNGKPIYVRDGN